MTPPPALTGCRGTVNHHVRSRHTTRSQPNQASFPGLSTRTQPFSPTSLQPEEGQDARAGCRAGWRRRKKSPTLSDFAGAGSEVVASLSLPAKKLETAIILVQFVHVERTKTQGTSRSWESLPKQGGFERPERRRAAGATHAGTGATAAPCSACSPKSRAPASERRALTCIYFHRLLFPPHAALAGLMPLHHRH